MAGDVVLLGEIEQLILLGVLRLGESAYAVTIRQEVADRTGILLPRGTIYVTLDRLERKGLVRSTFGDPTAERGGKAKRFYTLQPAGMQALRVSTRAVDRLLAGTRLASARGRH